MSDEAGGPKTTFATEVIAGITTFMAMAYVAFANPAILAAIHIAPEATFVWTCMVAAVASLVAGLYVNLPTALACGMGVNAFVVSYANHDKSNPIAWQTMLATCLLAGIAVTFLTAVRARRLLLDAVPPQIYAAVKAGVGAVLTSLAFKQTAAFGKEVGTVWAWALFALGILIILGFRRWYARHLAPTADGRPRATSAWVDIVGNSAFLVSTVVVLLTTLAGSPLKHMQHSQNYWIAWQQPGSFAAVKFDDKYVGFGIALVFLLLLDIAGSPMDFRESEVYSRDLTPDQKERVGARGFWVDSIANIVAPIVGVTPVVYTKKILKMRGATAPLDP